MVVRAFETSLPTISLQNNLNWVAEIRQPSVIDTPSHIGGSVSYSVGGSITINNYDNNNYCTIRIIAVAVMGFPQIRRARYEST